MSLTCEYLAGVPKDDEMDAEEIDPDEIDDILHDVESNKKQVSRTGPRRISDE